MHARLALAARVARAARAGRLRGRGALRLVRPPPVLAAARTRLGRATRRTSALGCAACGLDHRRRHRRGARPRARAALQPARPAAQPHRERVGAGRRPAAAPLRPDPEPRRDGQGLRRARARDVRGGHAARTRGAAGAGPAEQGAAENMLGQAIGRLFAVAEAYPELRANENFQQLQDELAETENGSPSRARSTTTPCSPTTTPSRPCRRARRRDVRLLEARSSSRSRSGGPRGAAGRVLAAARRSLRRRSRSPAHAAAAKSFALPAARRRRPASRRTASLRVDEQITFAFDGAFSGAYRDIPLRDGESIDEVVGLGGGRAVPPGRLRGARLRRRARHVRRRRATDKGMRIVWHYQRPVRAAHVHGPLPAPRPRRRLRRRRRRQPQGLGRRVGGRPRQLTAVDRSLPARRSLRAWGHPDWVRGDVTRRPRRALRALDIPARPVRRAARRLPAPAAHLDGRREGRAGPGSQTIVAEEARRRRRLRARPARRSTTRSDHLARTLADPARARARPGARARRAASGCSTAASARPATTASTSRSRRPTRSPRSCRRCSAQGGDVGSTSSPRRSST